LPARSDRRLSENQALNTLFVIAFPYFFLIIACKKKAVKYFLPEFLIFLRISSVFDNREKEI